MRLWFHCTQVLTDTLQHILKGTAKYRSEVVGNKAKARISKRVFQENKAREIFRKTNISYPLIRTSTPFCLINDEVEPPGELIFKGTRLTYL